MINNAGVCRIGPLDWQSLEEMKKIADVNLWGLIDVTKTFLPLLKMSGGRLVNVASIGGTSISEHDHHVLLPTYKSSNDTRGGNPLSHCLVSAVT